SWSPMTRGRFDTAPVRTLSMCLFAEARSRPRFAPVGSSLATTAPASSPPSAPTTVTYHESCHLCHGQKISAQPRAILRAIPGLELRECAESQWCCGSAGIYTITQPDTAARLQNRKVGHILATGAHLVATANPGCHLQLENGLRAACASPSASAPNSIPLTPPSVTHPVVLLARAYADE
ncbi:MAG: (Fe-S)-binding protein, partial [Burkholderiales bacterium]|nr:(Fe-S)-binding protein [Opitutaceae bacterium]